MNEDSILAQCHQWIWNTYPQTRLLSWHIANERKTTPTQGAKLKAKGVIAGVPDYVLNWQGKTYYFEFKTSKGTVSKQQQLLHYVLFEQGFETEIIRDVETFKKLITNILNNGTNT